MIKRLSAICLCVLASCTEEPASTGFLKPPDADGSVVTAPLPLLDKDGFMALFADLCLQSPAYQSSFETAARRYGLRETRAGQWASEVVGIDSALEISVGTGDILHETAGDGSGPPNRVRHCSVHAHLPPIHVAERKAMADRVTRAFLPLARRLDYSPYFNGTAVQQDSIEVIFKPADWGSYVDMRPGAACPQSDPCWRRTPFRLELKVTGRSGP